MKKRTGIFINLALTVIGYGYDNCLDKNEYYNRKPIEERQPAPIIKSDTVAVIDNKNRKLAKK